MHSVSNCSKYTFFVRSLQTFSVGFKLISSDRFPTQLLLSATLFPLTLNRSRPLPSSPGLHSWSSQRLATKNWKIEANLAENGRGWSAPAQLWSDGTLWIDQHGFYLWMWLRPRHMLQRVRELKTELFDTACLLHLVPAISHLWFTCDIWCYINLFWLIDWSCVIYLDCALMHMIGWQWGCLACKM